MNQETIDTAQVTGLVVQPKKSIGGEFCGVGACGAGGSAARAEFIFGEKDEISTNPRDDNNAKGDVFCGVALGVVIGRNTKTNAASAAVTKSLL